ncbi:MAG: hypothetical protein ACE148_01410 [Vicinamibacterales bacterium]
MTRSDGRPVAVQAEVLGASVHGQMGVACVACHADLGAVTEWPHAEKLAPAACSQCHAPAVEEYDKSVHAELTGGGGGPLARCGSCHGAHDIRPVNDPQSRVYHLNLPATCGVCHGGSGAPAPGRPPGVLGRFQDSIHGQALARSGLLVAPNCSDCHGYHLVLRNTDSASRVFRTAVPETCGKCHEGIRNLYDRGVHGAALAAGSALAPVCSTCHTAHDISRADLDTWRLQVIDECGTCHPQSVHTYRDTYHGQVTSLGFVRVATCSDCHKSHDVFPKEDSRSPVSQAKRVETCRKCHSRATASFARYDPHPDRHDRGRNPILYYAGRFMDSLLLVVFAFFGLHTSLWFVREVGHRRSQHRVSSQRGEMPGQQAPGRERPRAEATGGEAPGARPPAGDKTEGASRTPGGGSGKTYTDPDSDAGTRAEDIDDVDE